MKSTVSQHGIDRLDSIFKALRSRRVLGVMPFITAGYPSLEVTAATLPALAKAGASVIELGIPFSDPIADGPVIASSMHEALKSGVTPPAVFEIVARVRADVAAGLVAMVSCSIVERTGAANFIEDAARAGFDGLIIPDIDLDAAEPMAELARMHGIGLTLLVAPTSSAARIARIAKLCSGFVYVLARAGITGEGASIDLAHVQERAAAVRAASDLPVAVGFGISRAEQVSALAQVKGVDAVIVGSAIVKRMGSAKDPVQEAQTWVGTLVDAARSRP